MGFLDRLKASQASTIEHWTNLDTQKQLDTIDELSKTQPVVIFKHSTTCGISAGAKHRLEGDWSAIPEGTAFYYLDLLNHRDISNNIAERYGIRHESPQILVIKDGKATYNTSHQRINAKVVAGQLG